MFNSLLCCVPLSLATSYPKLFICSLHFPYFLYHRIAPKDLWSHSKIHIKKTIQQVSVRKSQLIPSPCAKWTTLAGCTRTALNIILPFPIYVIECEIVLSALYPILASASLCMEDDFFFNKSHAISLAGVSIYLLRILLGLNSI